MYNIDMDKKVCIITGANSGIGFEAAGQIADEGFHVVLACRSRERGEAALKRILDESPQRSVELMIVDMSLMSSVRKFADSVTREHGVIDVLIHNAADFDISRKKPVYTEEGIESIWATNHIGPVLLTELLLNSLKRSEEGRIITVASKGLIMKPFMKVDLYDPEFRRRRFSVSNAYYQSKKAQIIYTYHLRRRLENSPVTCNCIRVTNVKIDISRYPDVSSLMKKMYALKSKKSITASAMAGTYTYAAVSSRMRGKSGLYIDENNNPVSSGRYTCDEGVQNDVMALTFSYIPEIGNMI
ncbi:MAG: SDR family NAD(P)-dependent oxidoreductase [Sphaerochaetaceae bacterium]|nr:SDR family NAD(P)-dependent oxidoreductase [Sphaerochaetaceae bacterium]